ncbi:MAG: hypothetical protein LBI17_02880, partial [Rickettsiales bacterium]|nr:hypothetical protein [Rickettsiales bacterium]
MNPRSHSGENRNSVFRTIILIEALLLPTVAQAAKQCMPCPAGKWGMDGKCEQDCPEGYYCVGGSKIPCDANKGECCPTGSTHPSLCKVSALTTGWTQEWTCSTTPNLLPKTFPAYTVSPGTYSYCNCR